MSNLVDEVENVRWSRVDLNLSSRVSQLRDFLNVEPYALLYKSHQSDV